MPRWRQPAAIMGLVAGTVALTLLSCAEERGITPGPTKYQAILLTADTYSYQEYTLRTLDLNTDALVGEISIDVGSRIPDGMAVTPDGRYGAAFHGVGRIQVFDLQSLTLAQELRLSPPGLSSIHFLPGPELKLLACCRISCMSTVYDVTTGLVDTMLPGTRLAFNSPDQRELLTISSDALIRRSYETCKIVDSFSFVSPRGGVYVYGAEVPTAYDGIYLIGSDSGGSAIFRFDLSDHSCSFRQPLLPNSQQRRFALSPDGSEIWVLQFTSQVHEVPGRIETEFWEYILILDASTGAPLDTINTVGLKEQNPESPTGMTAIAFHPEEPVVYVTTQSSLSMLVINRTTREIIDSIDVGYALEVVISPSPNTSAHTR